VTRGQLPQLTEKHAKSQKVIFDVYFTLVSITATYLGKDSCYKRPTFIDMPCGANFTPAIA